MQPSQFPTSWPDRGRLAFVALAVAGNFAAFVGCRDAARTANQTEPESASTGPAMVEPVDLGLDAPSFAVGDLYLCGQPRKEDFARWARRGIKTVVKLRMPDDVDWDEGREVRVVGMNYVELALDPEDELSDEVFTKVREVLANEARRPLVLHSATTNRVGAAWMTYRVLDEGVGPDKAFEEAVRLGLKKPASVQRARDYIRKQRLGDKVGA